MFQVNKTYLYLFLIFIYGLINYTLQSNIINENLLIESFQDQMAYERILKMIDNRNKFVWINYLLLPITYLLKFTLISFWILCGAIVFNLKNKFEEIFKIVIVAEFVWLLPSLLLILWFGVFDFNYTYTDVQYFAPLSLLNLFEASQLDSWLIFPLKSLNLFEVIYLLVLALGIKKIMKKDYDSALRFTLPVYGSALVVWILFVTFLSINLGA